MREDRESGRNHEMKGRRGPEMGGRDAFDEERRWRGSAADDDRFGPGAGNSRFGGDYRDDRGHSSGFQSNRNFEGHRPETGWRQAEDNYRPGQRGTEFEGGWDEGHAHAHEHDRDYQQWRQDHVSKLDEDYNEFRNERRKKFADEFEKWRQERAKHGSENSPSNTKK